jgi:hypothetical protein
MTQAVPVPAALSAVAGVGASTATTGSFESTAAATPVSAAVSDGSRDSETEPDFSLVVDQWIAELTRHGGDEDWWPEDDDELETAIRGLGVAG